MSEKPAINYENFYDYRVDILRRRNQITASLNGTVLAQSDRTLLVDEQNHGLVFYFPPSHVNLDQLAEAPDVTSRCPWKGIASYWRAKGGEQPIAWTYKEPLAEVAQIRGYIAFYQDRVAVQIGVAPYLSLSRGG